VGCGIGTITNELRKHIGASEAVGIDIAEDAIAHASDAYPKCSFSALAAEELSALGGEPFDLIHGREVYPVTRTDSAPYQLAFLGALARHLRPGGALLLTMVKEARGLGNTYAALATELESVGLEPIVRVPAIPRRLYRISGRASYLPIVHPMLTRASRLLFPDKLQYFYITRKLAG
jgi:trans-aconitate methyltransferase